MSTSEPDWREGPSLLASVRRYLYAVLAAVLLFGVAGYWLSAQQQPVYAATTRLFLADPRTQAILQEDPRAFPGPELYVPQQTERVTSRPVLERAVELLPEPAKIEGLAQRVVAEGDSESATIVVTATAPTAEAAAATANAVATGYQLEARDRVRDDAEAAAEQLEAPIAEAEEAILALQVEISADPEGVNAAARGRLEAVTEQLFALQRRQQHLLVGAAVIGDGVDLVETAAPPEEPVSPKPERDAALAAVLGAGLAAAAAYWKAGRSLRAESRMDPARVLAAPLLGEVPSYRVRRAGALAERVLPPAAAAEAYQFLLSALEFALAEIGARSVLVTSAAPGDGKTTTALQLAVAGAHDEGRVLLIDADLRVRGLTRLLGLERHRGLVEATLRQTTAEGAISTCRMAERLAVPFVPAGQPPRDPASFVRSSGLEDVLEQFTKTARLVIVDSSPLLSVTDPSVVANLVDAVVLVVDRGTSLHQLALVRERLKFVSTPLIGYIYNRSDEGTASYEYTYGSVPHRNGRRGPHGASRTWSEAATSKTRTRSGRRG